jgi:DNA replication and repair protein RecF
LSVPPVWLSHLTVHHYRCHWHVEVALDVRPVLLTGVNGLGKTALLEAVSLLCAGQGLRQASLSDFTTHDALTPWAVRATIEREDTTYTIATGGDETLKRRLIKINDGEAVTQHALEGLVPMVWLTPRHDRLFMEGATDRRRFFDRLVYGLHHTHAKAVTRLEKAVRERQRILEEHPNALAWLTAIEEQLAHTMLTVALNRHTVLTRLNALSPPASNYFPTPILTGQGFIETLLGNNTSHQDIIDLTKKALETNRFGYNRLVRFDVSVLHADKKLSAHQCSTGEQKALLIAIILRHALLLAAQHAVMPILLLDEIAAHLDATRLEALFMWILDTKSQAWLTGTDGRLFDALGPYCQAVTLK